MLRQISYLKRGPRIKEHRSLIDKGVDRKQIQLQNWDIYINDKPHYNIVDSKLDFHVTSPYAPVPSPNLEVNYSSVLVINNQSG